MENPEERIPKRKRSENEIETPIIGRTRNNSSDDEDEIVQTPSLRRSETLTGAFQSPLNSVSSTSGTTNSFALLSTVLSKSISMVTEVSKESIMALESDLMNYENSQKSANVNHWDYFTLEAKAMVKSILRRAYQRDAIHFEKQLWENYESFDRTFLFNLLKRFAPEASGKSTGIMTITDRFMQLKYDFDVFKGAIDTSRFVQQIYTMQLTYKTEIDSQEAALVKILIDNMINELLIQKRLKALVKVQNPKTIEEFCDALENQADYLTKIVLEVVTYLGVDRGVFTMSKLRSESGSEVNKEPRGFKICNGCGVTHGGICMLFNHPNYNTKYETVKWKDSDSGKALLKLGYEFLPWNKQIQTKNGQDELVNWSQAPPRPLKTNDRTKRSHHKT
jgi:hypothetical protein